MGFKEDWFGKGGKKAVGSAFPPGIKGEIDRISAARGQEPEIALLGTKKISDDHRTLSLEVTTDDPDGIPPALGIEVLRQLLLRYEQEWASYCKLHGISPELEGSVTRVEVEGSHGCGDPKCTVCGDQER